MIGDALGGSEAVVVNPTGRWRAGLVDGQWVTAPPFAAVPLADAVQPAPAEVRSVDGSVENGAVRVRWDEASGVMTSVVDLVSDREVLASDGGVLQLFDDRPVEYDAWDIDAHTLAHPSPWTSVESVSVTGGRVCRFAGVAVRSFADHTTAAAASRPRCVDVECEVDWHEDRTLLKVAFPVAIHSLRATYETQYGAVERPTHRNTSWDAARFEVPAQRWADLSEAGYGVALLNDSKHGYDIAGNVMRLTLLRSTMSPDPLADRGEHRFTYSLFPHPGSWQQGGVVEAAEDLNRPLRIVADGRPDPIDAVARRAGSGHRLREEGRRCRWMDRSRVRTLGRPVRGQPRLPPASLGRGAGRPPRAGHRTDALRRGTRPSRARAVRGPDAPLTAKFVTPNTETHALRPGFPYPA